MKLIPGENDLASQHPDLMKEWDYELNADIDPTQLRQYSNKAVFWKCAEGHSWKTRINNRTAAHSSCPICSKVKTVNKLYYSDIPVSDSLAYCDPGLAEQWNIKKNGSLTAFHVYKRSNRKVWWKCPEGHEWIASVNNRMAGNGCPYCTRHRSDKK